MEIKEDGVYSISETAKKTSLTSRWLQRYAKQHYFEKVDNRYLFSGKDIKKIILDRANQTTMSRQNDIERQSAPTYNNVSKEVIKLVSEIDNDDYIIALLNAVKEDKHIEEFTIDEYTLLQERLQSLNKLDRRIDEYKEEIKRMDEYVKDYRQNVEYFKKSLERKAEETEILLKTITQRNYIEAKEKGFDE